MATRNALPHGIPHRWEICEQCEGHGGSSAHLGAFTSSEWAEQDDDFKRDYLRGDYDRPCGHCGGTGKIQVPDVTRCTFAQKRELVELRQAARHKAEADAEARYWRRLEAHACGERD